jgi:hypothetical protein
VSSEIAYQNVSRPEVTSSVVTGRKAQKRPFYSFLLFDDKSQKAPATASTAVYMNTPIASQAAPGAAVIDYPEPEVQKPVSVNNIKTVPETVAAPSSSHKKPQFNSESVFSNKEVTDKVKRELTKIFINYN